MTHASLFNGIGGFQLAAEWAGWDNVMSCEINTVLNKLTKKHYPNCYQHGDIRKTDFTIWRDRIDILTGGFPCQPFSVAGQRRGTEDDRHLWPEMLRAIREIRPRWVVGENVRGFTNWNDGVVFDHVLSDLENEGYETQAFILPAAGVNAPHRRDRVWIVAYRADAGTDERVQDDCNAKSTRLEGRIGFERSGGFEPGCQKDVAYGNEVGSHGGWWHASRRSESADGHDADTNGERCDELNVSSVSGKSPRFAGRQRIEDWSDWPTEPGLRERNDGMPEGLARRFVLDSLGSAVSEEEIERLISQAATAARIESIMGYGNAIVPQVAHRIFTAINETINH